MKELDYLNENELVDTNGGVVDPVTVYKVVAAVVGVSLAAYDIVKREVAEAGKRDAYIAIMQSS